MYRARCAGDAVDDDVAVGHDVDVAAIHAQRADAQRADTQGRAVGFLQDRQVTLGCTR